MSLKRILKPGGVITAQVGSKDKKPKQVDSWLKVLSKNFGNAKLDEVHIQSFDCRWNFASSNEFLNNSTISRIIFSGIIFFLILEL